MPITASLRELPSFFLFSFCCDYHVSSFVGLVWNRCKRCSADWHWEGQRWQTEESVHTQLMRKTEQPMQKTITKTKCFLVAIYQSDLLSSNSTRSRMWQRIAENNRLYWSGKKVINLSGSGLHNTRLYLPGSQEGCSNSSHTIKLLVSLTSVFWTLGYIE